jgi:PrgI family protein
MPRVHELPTHLQVEDVLLAGLTARQLLRLMIGASLAYGLWDQAISLPIPIRAVLAAVLAAAGLLVALFQPGGRPLDQWVLAALLFALLPRRLVWRPSEPDIRKSSRPQSGWAELAPRPEWVGIEPCGDPDDGRTPAPHTMWWRRSS